MRMDSEPAALEVLVKLSGVRWCADEKSARVEIKWWIL
jgi:hypothetical protein